jgi:hypothetical protein
MHTLRDRQGHIPAFIAVQPAKIHEIHRLDELRLEPGSLYLMDRASWDFACLYALEPARAFFVIRARKDFAFHRLGPLPVDKSTGLRGDQTLRRKSFYPAKFYPQPWRGIRYHDAATDKILIFLTNNFFCPRSPSCNFTSAAGRSNCSSSGSNSICASRDFMAFHPMR